MLCAETGYAVLQLVVLLEAFDFEAELRIVIARKCRDEVPENLRERIHKALLQEGELGEP